ncbi:MAG: cell division protein SepF [Ruminococcaceae bacterium]|nr:cell division protein SepF [Oscillospiraceae bacterium]
MGKFWMNDSNKSANDDFDIDVDKDYYSKFDGMDSYNADDLYSEFGTIDSDVKVVAPEEDEEPTLYKVLYAPESCQDSRDIVDSLVAGRVVVINVADLDRENFFRLLDYVMGALQALGGDMKRYGKKVVVLYPAGVDMDTPLDEIEDEPYEDNEEELDGND